MKNNLAIIGVPVDLGAGRRGVDMGPSAVRYANLRTRIEQLGWGVRDSGNIAVPTIDELPQPHPTEKLRYLQPLAEMNHTLARSVYAAMQSSAFPLIVGGDHSLSIGSVNGVAAHAGRIGLLWIDAHGDFNTADTTPSGNIHGMSVATLTGRGHESLVSILANVPAVQDANVVYVGVRDLDALEKVAMRAAGVHVFTMHDVDRQGMAEVMEDAIRLAGTGTTGIHLSLDMDSLDPNDAPGVGTPVPGGLTYREAHLAMEMIHESGRLISMDLVEVNPILDVHNKTAELAVELACSALGKRIF
jgi:arginase